MASLEAWTCLRRQSTQKVCTCAPKWQQPIPHLTDLLTYAMWCFNESFDIAKLSRSTAKEKRWFTVSLTKCSNKMLLMYKKWLKTLYPITKIYLMKLNKIIIGHSLISGVTLSNKCCITLKVWHLLLKAK